MRINVRHEHALAEARRQCELAAAKAGVEQAGDTAENAFAPVNGRQVIHAGRPAAVTAGRSTAWPQHEKTERAESAEDPPTGEVKVPATAATLGQWAATWIRMCADGNLVLGPLNDDEHARREYDVSAKQLRNIRNAATSGALRRRADQLGVRLPAGYIDDPSAGRVNGQALTVASA